MTFSDSEPTVARASYVIQRGIRCFRFTEGVKHRVCQLRLTRARRMCGRSQAPDFTPKLFCRMNRRQRAPALADLAKSRVRDVRRTSAGVRSRIRNRGRGHLEIGPAGSLVPTVGFAAVRTSHERDSGAEKGLAAGARQRPFLLEFHLVAPVIPTMAYTLPSLFQGCGERDS